MDVVGKRGKTLVSSFLASAMMLGMVAMPGLEVKAEEYYSLDVGGVTVTDQNCNDLEHNHWSYDDDTHTLTLKDYECTLNDKTIIQSYDENPITIVLIGENKLQGNGNYGSGILEGGFTIKGEGSLEIKGTGSSTRGIAGSYTQDGGSVVIDAPVGIDCSSYTNGINVNDGELTINAANIGIRVRDEDRNDEYDADVKINGGTVTVNSYDTGIMLDYYAHYIQNGGTVNINAEKYGIIGEQAEIRSGLFSGTAGSVVISTNTFINDVPLWGWTNVEGTQGKTFLETNTAAYVMDSFKKVETIQEEIKEISSLSFDVATPGIGTQISDEMSPAIDVGETLASLGEGKYTATSRYYKYLPSEYGYDHSFSETVDYGRNYYYRIDITLDPLSPNYFSDDVEITVNGEKVDFDNNDSFVLKSNGKYEISFYGTLTSEAPTWISNVFIKIPKLYADTSLSQEPSFTLKEPFSTLENMADYTVSSRYVSFFPSVGEGWNSEPYGLVKEGEDYYYEIKISLPQGKDRRFDPNINLQVNGSSVVFDSVNYEASVNGLELTIYCKVTADPPVVRYPFYIGEEQVMSDNCDNLTLNKWKYEEATNTLTLDGLTLDDDIIYQGDSLLNIVVLGENSVAYGFTSTGAMAISGTGSLTSGAIICDNDITINSGNLNMESKEEDIITARNLTVNGGTIEVKSGEDDYQTAIKITGVSDKDNKFGVYLYGGKVNINGEYFTGIEGDLYLSGSQTELNIIGKTGISGDVAVEHGKMVIEASFSSVVGDLSVSENDDIYVKITNDVQGAINNKIPGAIFTYPEMGLRRFPLEVGNHDSGSWIGGQYIYFPAERVKDITFDIEAPESGSLMECMDPHTHEKEIHPPVTIIDGEFPDYSIDAIYISGLPSSGDVLYYMFPEGEVWPGTVYHFKAEIKSPYWIDKDINLTVNGKHIDIDNDPDFEMTVSSDSTYITVFGTVTVDPNGPTPMPPLDITPNPVRIIQDDDNDSYFPDKNFREFVEKYDKDHDGDLSWFEISHITSLDVSHMGIMDLTGIDIFRNLLKLNCEDNALQDIDLDKNTKLQELDCSSNKITMLNLNKHKDITKIDCSDNQIVMVEFDKCEKLESLDCSENRVAQISLKKNKELKTLNCADNMIMSLDLSKNTKLEKLDCTYNKVTQLDIRNNPELIASYRADNREKFDYDEEVTIIAPEAGPTVTPTTIPLPTGFVMPTINPTVVPTTVPSKVPTKAPTTAPAGPTNKPVVTPASKPTVKPTAKPTTKPAEPTKAAVTLTINKATVNLVCGASETLKATLKGSSAKIKWTTSDKSVATVDASGKVSAKMAGTVAIVASAAGKSSTCVVTVLYKDVTNKKDFWFVPTNYLTAGGIVKGYDKQTNFKPANDCSRAQMVTFLWRLAGQPAPKATTTSFKDIKKTDYFYKPVLWAVEKGITTGVSKTKFAPQDICTRAQTVTFLWRMAGKPSTGSSKNPFKDVKKGDYFYYPVIWASAKKIVAGYSDGTFKPQGKCLRRQMVTFLYKYDKFITGNG